MADSKGFHVSLRGFRRQDVLHYIDDLQEQHQDKEKRLQQGLANANQMLRDLSAEVEQLRASLQESGGECDRLRSDLAQTGEERDRLRSEVALAEEREETYAEQSRECRRQAEAYEAARAQLMAAQQQLEQLEALRQQEAEQYAASDYATLRQEMAGLADHVRVRGMDFIDTSRRQSQSCLDEVEKTVDTIETQLTQVRHTLDTTRDRLDEQGITAQKQLNAWARSMGGTADLTEQPTPVAEPQPAQAVSAEPTPVAEPQPTVSSAVTEKPESSETRTQTDVLDRLMGNVPSASEPTPSPKPRTTTPPPRRPSAPRPTYRRESRDSALRRWLDEFWNG